MLKTAQGVAGGKPVLLTINEAGTREGAALARKAAAAGADGLMIVPSPIYHTNPQETVATLKAVATAGGLPVMIYSNRVAYRVDVTVDDHGGTGRAIRCSSRSRNRPTTSAARPRSSTASATASTSSPASTILPSRRCSVGAIGWVAGLVTAFPRETVAIYQLMKQGRRDEALAIYRWFRPLLDLDVSTYLVQNIKLAEVHAIGTNDRVRMPRQPLSGERRKAAEKVIKDALAVAAGIAEPSDRETKPAGGEMSGNAVGRNATSPSSAPASSASAPPPIWPKPAVRSRSSTAPASARRPVPAMPPPSPFPTCCRWPTRA